MSYSQTSALGRIVCYVFAEELIRLTPILVTMQRLQSTTNGNDSTCGCNVKGAMWVQ